MEAYSMDLRRRVIGACDAGKGTKEVAATFGVSPAWVRRLKQHRRVRGRCPSGARLVAKVPHGHWHTTTLIAALGHAGVGCATTVDGAVNRDVFEAFVAQVLVPMLSPGDVVGMDNLSSHKGPRVRQMIEAVGAALVYLPPYSPDFNPIELAFAQLTQLMRSAA